MIKPTVVAIVIAAACAGAVACASHGLWGLSLNLRVRPTEIATLGVSIYIAFFLQTYFERRSGDLRSEKDLLIEDSKEVISVLRTCRDELEACFYSGQMQSREVTRVLALLRQLANALDQMETALRQSHCACLISEFNATKDAYYRFKCAATGGGFPSQPFTGALFALQSRVYRDMRTSLQSLLFRINRYQ